MTEVGGKGSMERDRWFEALIWYGKMRDANEKDLDVAVGRKWQDWCAEPENREVFESVSRLLADREAYRKRPSPTGEELGEDSYDLSVPIAVWRGSGAKRGNTKARPRGCNVLWQASRVIAVAAMAALFAVMPLRRWSSGSPDGSITYETRVGDLKEVHLPDGSSIILGGSTTVSVAFTPERRAIRLVCGEAWFTVAHDGRRPFVVSAGDGAITDLGTAFLVTRESDRVVVVVTQGRVEVTATPPAGSPFGPGQNRFSTSNLASIRLSHGEEVALTDTGALSHVKPTDARAATAWTRGRLTFDEQPLRYVVQTVNRYSAEKIVVDPAAGTLRFSGIVFENEIGEWLQSLQEIFPVVVRKRDGSVRIQMRSSPPTLH